MNMEEANFGFGWLRQVFLFSIFQNKTTFLRRHRNLISVWWLMGMGLV